MNPKPYQIIPFDNASRWRQFIQGFSFPFRGVTFVLRTPTMWPWVVLPVLLMSFLIIAAGFIAMWAVPEVLAYLWDQPMAGWLRWLWNGLATAVWLVVFIVTTVVLYLCFGILATPFYDQLSEQTEAHLIEPRSAVTWPQWFGDIGQSILHSVAAFALWFCFVTLTLGLGLIPVLGQALDLVLGGSLTAFLLAREMMDGPMSRRRLSFRTKCAVVWRNLPVALGFGLATSIFLAIPIVNLFSLPCAVVGGTRLFLQLSAQGRVPLEVPRDEWVGRTLLGGGFGLSENPEHPGKQEHVAKIDDAINTHEHAREQVEFE